LALLLKLKVYGFLNERYQTNTQRLSEIPRVATIPRFVVATTLFQLFNLENSADFAELFSLLAISKFFASL
jgi:hypothetical protein